MPDTIDTHPVQTGDRRGGRISTKVTLAAYEVYKKLFGEQQALIAGECRGGFGTGELIAFLYAKTFPVAEWYDRFHEALEGAERLG